MKPIRRQPRRVKKTQNCDPDRRELVIITGLSGSGKGTVLKVLEDSGFYSVDNLPIELIPKFAELTSVSPNIRRAALVVDIREGEALKRFPSIYKSLRRELRTTLLFLEAADDMLVRRYSETRSASPARQRARPFRKISKRSGTRWRRSGLWRTSRSTRRSSPSMSCVTW